MTSRSISWRLATLALGAVFVVAGCGPSNDGDPKPTGSTTTSNSGVAADVPTGFDPCKGIPQSVLDSEKLRLRGEANTDAGSVKWRGCRYGRTDGYFVSITTSNLTVDMTRSKNFPDAAEFTTAGRKAIATRQFDGPNIKEACTVNVEMKGGSLDINLSNPASNRDTGSIDSCQLARGLAEKIAPSIPVGA